LRLDVEKEITMPAFPSVLRTAVILLLALAALWVHAVPAHAILECDFGADVPTTRPAPEAGPTEMTVEIYVFDLVSIDSVKQEFTLDVFIEGQWEDQRLGSALRAAGVRKCRVPFDSIWTPGMILLNSREYKSDLKRVATVSADGTVESKVRFTGTFSAPMDLSNFPLDSQTLAMTSISPKYSPDELTFITSRVGAAQNFTEPGWYVRLGEAYAGSYKLDVTKGEGEGDILSRFDIEIEVERDVTYYVWKVILPLCIIVFASWTVFWIDPTQLGVQTGISTASLLTAIAFLLSLGNILPPPYLTRLDVLVYSSIFLIFMVLVEAISTCTLAAHGKADLARRVDWFSRAVFPSAFTAVMVWFWLV
jgi:hypothetical protein